VGQARAPFWSPLVRLCMVQFHETPLQCSLSDSAFENRDHVRTVLVTAVKDMVKSCPMMPRLQVGSLSSLVGSWRRRQPVLHTNVLRGLASNKYRHILLS